MSVAIAPTFGRTPRPQWDLTLVQGEPGRVPADDLNALAEPDLVAATLQGRSSAFDLIVERHRRAVYQVCYRFVNNHEDASDLSQDVFLRVFRGLSNFKGQSSLGTWVHRIAINVCLNHVSLKRPVSESIGEQQFVDDSAPSPHAQMLSGERSALIRAAVARLPRKQRSALVLRVFQDLSHQEIAEALGISVGAVKANVFHALQNLKKMIGDRSDAKGTT
jgi:RNA polymerase sigma-70 factor (ECF subfamily)